MKNTAIAFILMVLTAVLSTVFGQSGDFATKGRVITSAGKGIPDATISYMSVAKRLSWDFSDSNGYFGGKTSAISNPNQPNSRIEMPASGPIDIDVFDLQGKKVSTLHYTNIQKGGYSLEMVSPHLSKSLYLYKIHIGGKVENCKMLLIGNTDRSVGENSNSSLASPTVLAKIASASDSVRIGKTGYTPVKVAINSYTSDIGNVTLTPIDIEAQVTTMLGQLSQAEKVGQLVQADCPGASAVTSNVLT